jgi:hypothetical protein
MDHERLIHLPDPCEVNADCLRSLAIARLQGERRSNLGMVRTAEAGRYPECLTGCAAGSNRQPAAPS